jgi:iron complex transport system substrate-binding protein
MKLKITGVIFLIILFSCSNKKERSYIQHDNQKESVKLKYAKGFKIDRIDHNKLITVLNPWSGANNIEYQYLFIPKEDELPEYASEYKVIRTPVERVICLSTTHIAFIDVLNRTNTIVGVSGIDYVNNTKVREKIESDQIPDVGYDNSLNYELIVRLKPDLVITYGVGSQVASYNQKLQDLGINTVIIGEYLENHPLGKLEWLKFLAVLYNMDEKANEYLEKVEKEYNDLLAISNTVNKKPKVLFGLPWKDSWYVPGGQSYLAKMVEDAGGEYLWKENESRESIPFNIESMFLQASSAEVWLNTGSINKKTDILKIDERFESFKPYRYSLIYNNNLQSNKYGGNNYWEKGLVEPHIVLKDMIKIFHPELLIDYNLSYYKAIK